MSERRSEPWYRQTNIYEVNLRQYTPEGTILAFLPHLARLRNMGVQTLWFMPITPIAQKNKKGSLGSYYAASDYTSVNPEFGTLEDFIHLVKEAHALGFHVILDWVANHTGWDHVWTKAHPDYYLRDEASGDFKKASGMDDIIELDYNNPHLRGAMIDAMKFWVEKTNIDGFRCDLADWVELFFWKEARPELEKLKPLFWLGEFDPADRPAYMEVFDAAYTWTWMHETSAFYARGLPLEHLTNILQRYSTVPGMKCWFTSNHDENSWNGTEYEKYGQAAEALTVHSCTWPGIPLVYSGQEIPNRKRLQFFEKDPIEWTDTLEKEAFYKTLLTLQSSHPALHGEVQQAPVYRLQTSANDRVLGYMRKRDGENVLVLLNLSPHDIHVEIQEIHLNGKFRNVFTGVTTDYRHQKQFDMKPWEYLVYVSIAS